LEKDTCGRLDLNESDKLRRILSGKKAVVFDFDNIIVDSEPFHFEAYSRVFARAGHTLDREEYWLEWTSRGGGAKGEIERHGLDLVPAEIQKQKDPIYSRFCGSGEIRLFPSAAAIIKILRDAGFTLAVASGSYEHDIRTILSANGIESHFEAVVGKDGIEKTKPHPETYLKACSKLGIAPAHCLAVEDAEKGVRSARDAGMSVIVIETPITRGLGIEGADIVLSGLERFLRILEKIYD